MTIPEQERTITQLERALAECQRERDALVEQNRRLAEANVELRAIVELDVVLLEAFEDSPEISLTTYIYAECDEEMMCRHLKNARYILNGGAS